LFSAPQVTAEKGSLSVSRRFQRVAGDGYVLLGDASGSVDAITGEGMSLAFKQAAALVEALDARDMRLYEHRHREIMTNPLRMATLMLLLDGREALQRKALSALSAYPQVFKSLLAAHVGHKPLTGLLSWQLVPFGLGVLRA
jgi:flavin-dependent dehydrogenase